MFPGTTVRVIGVIDLRAGMAVHARAGRRESYRPVQTTPPSFEPGNATALAEWYAEHGVDDLYVADLDAIGGGQIQHALIRQLSSDAFTLWLDAGVANTSGLAEALQAGARHVVVGLETLPSFDALAEICAAAEPDSVVFSLDLREREPIGSAGMLGGDTASRVAMRAVERGAGTIIVLDLARVGTGRGPDFELLDQIRAAVPGVSLVAGGGVRGVDDLVRLGSVGCEAALVASALLDGRLAAGDVTTGHRSDSR